MTLLTSSEAEKAAQQEKYKIQEVKTQLDYSTQSLDSLATLYSNNKTRIDSLKSNNKGVDTGPWKNLSNNIQAINTPGILEPRSGKDHIFNYIFEQPMSFVYNNPDPLLKSTLPSSIPNIKPLDYSNIFSDAQIKGIFNMKISLTQALTSLDGFNITKFQEALTNIKTTLTEELFEDVKIFRDIIDVVNNEITNPQSIIYKGEKAYGPYSVAQINLFRLPPELIEIRNSCNGILGEIRNLFTIIDKLLNIPEDIIARAALVNAGLTQSSTDPNIFNAPVIEEKDPWGIRFSYQKSISGQVFAQETVRDPSRSNTTLTPTFTGADDPNSFVERNNTLLNTVVNSKRDFYFQLLPAIKSNLPVSGGSDVPGAMPGIQFRIENNIVKHKIPGFSPVYQPMGIDSIKCTLVGMFTGNDGVDISASYSNDINAGLLAPQTELSSLFSSQTNTNPNPVSSTNNIDSSGLPIPSTNKANTASDVAVLSEDAFRGAQDFYNEIVISGREVEVELNLRKSSGPYPGGTPGPFRDAETGNPKFKALIKRLDLYYVRRDRCWFILDLEITDAGLIGKECINLTNIIEEATELFEEVEEAPIGLTKEELDKCFKDPLVIKYQKDKSGFALVVDKKSGLSYEYNIEKNSLRTDEIYPTSIRDTLNKLKTNRDSFKGGTRDRVGVLSLIVEIFLNSTQIIQKEPANTDPRWAPNLVKMYAGTGADGILGRLTDVSAIASQAVYAKYDYNSGLFYIVDRKGNFEGRAGFLNRFSTSRRNKKPLEGIAPAIDTAYTTDKAEIEESINFFLNDYLPLITFKPTTCDDILKNKQKTSQKKNNQQENKGSELETSLNLGLPNQPKNLQQTDFFKATQTNKTENKQILDTKIVELKSAVESGELDKFIQDGLTEYIEVLSTGESSTSLLSPDLIKQLKIQKEANNLSIENPNNKPINITIKSKGALLDATQSNEQELFIEVGYDISDSVILKSLDNKSSIISTSIYKQRVNKKANLIIKAYKPEGSNEVIYRVDGVDIVPK